MLVNSGKMIQKVVIGGVTITKGQKVFVKNKGNLRLPAHFVRGEGMTIQTIRVESRDGEPVNIKDAPARDINIGLRMDSPRQPFHDLDGRTENRRGWWINGRDLLASVDLTQEKYYIKKSLVYRGQDLKGKKCALLFTIDDNLAVVDFEEDIGGFSADGMTKKGHCLLVETHNLRRMKKSEELEESRSDKIKKKKEVNISYDGFATFPDYDDDF